MRYTMSSSAWPWRKRIPGVPLGEITMLVTTGNEVAGRSITSYIGIFRGIVVRSPSLAQGFLGSLKQVVGGNIESFAQVCEAAREDAYERMVQHARERGADAVIGMRYDATEFNQGVTEVLAYGTAVKLSHG
jgi:uncharacterized protein YbjQ (UPF0145 family)